MNAVTDDARDPYARFWEQLEEVRRQNQDTDKQFLVAPAEATPGSGIAPRYVYEEQAVLVHDEDMSRVRQHTKAPEQASGVPGVRKLVVDKHIHVPTEVNRLNWLTQRGEPDGTRRIMASPNHLVSIAPVNLCPSGEPRPVPPGTPVWPDPRLDKAGHGISALVIDTGFQQAFADTELMLSGAGPLPGDAPRQLLGPSGLIKEYAGHGTFVAGVLLSAAPGVRVTVSSALQFAGAILEDKLGGLIIDKLDAAKDKDGRWPRIVSLSGGATTHDNHPLKGLAPLLDKLATDQDHTVLVAAAGNDGTSEHLFWPAAAQHHPGVISVGALRRDGRGRACFSNHGDWVTVFAYGEDVINAFPPGTYAYQHDSTAVCRYYSPSLYPDCGCVTPTRYGDMVAFDGRARWNGTSFATPLVAGMIAAHMTRIGETSDARRAAKNLLDRHATTIRDEADDEVLRVLR